ncbi:MAG: hypothetical protein JJU00_19850 [Opitutales bacterium]|nr:hypothetical protein [Opitutales bacterium]
MRNQLYRLDVGARGDRTICVKSYAIPPWARSIHYSWFGSKAARAYQNAQHLEAHGVGVPRPLGFFETWEGRWLKESYFVSEYVADATDMYAEMRRLLREDPDCHRYTALLRLVAAEVRKMHDSGFQHNDLGGQNILMRRSGAAWTDVSFIDLNRGRLHNALGFRRRAQDLANLEIPSFFRRVFFHIYFGDGPVPVGFSRWERFYRGLRTIHNESRKYRHPIRHYVLSRKYIGQPGGSPDYRDTWLWDIRSGQPAVVLDAPERRKFRPRTDVVRIVGENLPKLPSLWRCYRKCLAEAFTRPVKMGGRIGMSLDAEDPAVDAHVAYLTALPAVSVFIRICQHQGDSGIGRATEVIRRLRSAGNEVSVGLVQCRESFLRPGAWAAFVERALESVGDYVRYVEVGHAVNRVKWGMWRLDEIRCLWKCVPRLRERYPGIQFLGPGVNDFEYHYFTPLIRRMRVGVDGLSCHLYVDRRGAPEERQAGFSLVEKCCLGQAMARHFGTRGFYVTETNWPRTGADTYSPLTCGYRFPGQADSKLHVDVETYAAYMLRYYLISLTSGSVERVWWWRLAARGFGLADEGDESLDTLPCRAFRCFAQTLGDAVFLRREERGGSVWFAFDRGTVAYTLSPVRVQVPEGCRRIVDTFGDTVSSGKRTSVPLDSKPLYFLP